MVRYFNRFFWPRLTTKEQRYLSGDLKTMREFMGENDGYGVFLGGEGQSCDKPR